MLYEATRTITQSGHHFLLEGRHLWNPESARKQTLREVCVEGGSQTLSGFLVIRGPKHSLPTCYSVGGLGPGPVPTGLWSGGSHSFMTALQLRLQAGGHRD